MDIHSGGGIDEHLEESLAKIGALENQCLYRTAGRLIREVRRTAKAERRIFPYLRGTFHQMNNAASMLEPEVGREAAIEAIALLESEEHARAFQPSFDPQRYEYFVHWMTACSYDNLAKATAMIEGYNSPGVHDCINEGIQICHRTGKLECVTCFREYATDVYEAADDDEMALHYARGNANAPRMTERHDRRMVGHKDVGGLLLLRGQVAAAHDAYARAWELAETYHNPFGAKVGLAVDLATCRLLLGRPADLDPIARGIPTGEDPGHDLALRQLDALEHATLGDAARATEILAACDRLLEDRRCLNAWFANRLRLVAARRMAGDWSMARKFAQPLERKARIAHDWLTLRRLKHLLDAAHPATPYPTAAPLEAGPFAGGKAAAGATSPTAPMTRPAAPSVEPPAGTQDPARQAVPAEPGAPPADPAPAVDTPLDDELVAIHARLGEGMSLADALALFDELLRFGPDRVAHPHDACRLMYLAFLMHSQMPVPGEPAGSSPTGVQIAHFTGRARRVWAWAERLAGRFPDAADVTGVLANLGSDLRGHPTSPLVPEIPEDQIERLMRRALDLDPENAPNHARAGAFFLSRHNLGEAERILARGFRLARSSSFFALRLAELYRNSDRVRDALAVLDLCLREGADDAHLLWEAGLCAHKLEQHEVTLTYLDAFEARTGGTETLVHYYRALALLDLARDDEAALAIALELARIAHALAQSKLASNDDAQASGDEEGEEGEDDGDVEVSVDDDDDDDDGEDEDDGEEEAEEESDEEDDDAPDAGADDAAGTDAPVVAPPVFPTIELELDPAELREHSFHLAVLMAILAARKGDATLEEQLAVIQMIPLKKIQYITAQGLCRLADRLWQAAAPRLVPGELPARLFEDWLLASGLAPDTMFDRHRAQGTSESVHFFRVVFQQRLDERWADSAGCLAGQEEWSSYIAPYGVLARDADHATEIARAWQTRCHDGLIELLGIQGDGDYQDRPGVVWQGFHEPTPRDEDGEPPESNES